MQLRKRLCATLRQRRPPGTIDTARVHPAYPAYSHTVRRPQRPHSLSSDGNLLHARGALVLSEGSTPSEITYVRQSLPRWGQVPVGQLSKRQQCGHR